MIVLKEWTSNTELWSGTPVIFIMGVILLGLAVFCFIKAKGDWDLCGVGFVLAIFGLCMTIVPIICYFQPVHYYEHKTVTFTRAVNLEEELPGWELVEQDGKMYTFKREVEDTNE